MNRYNEHMYICSLLEKLENKREKLGEFPGNSVVRTQAFTVGPGFNFWSRNLIPQATQHSSVPPTPSPSKNKRNCCQSHHPNTTKGPYFRSSTLLENTQPSLSSPPLIYGTNQVFPQIYLEVLTENIRIKPCIYNVLLFVCVRS